MLQHGRIVLAQAIRGSAAAVAATAATVATVTVTAGGGGGQRHGGRMVMGRIRQVMVVVLAVRAGRKNGVMMVGWRWCGAVGRLAVLMELLLMELVMRWRRRQGVMQLGVMRRLQRVQRVRMMVQRVRMMVVVRIEVVMGVRMGGRRHVERCPRPEGKLVLVEHHGAFVLVHVGVVKVLGLFQRNVERFGFAGAGR